METERKLDVLADIARALNQSGVTWAVGGSLLLYFKGKTGVFRDIDLMVCETDVEKLKRAMLPLGNHPFVVPRDDDALAGALRALLTQPELRVQLGAANRRQAETHFDQQGMVTAWAGLMGGTPPVTGPR